MGRRDRAWPHHLSSLTDFCSARPQARKKFTHNAAFISGCPVSAPDPVCEIAGKALDGAISDRRMPASTRSESRWRGASPMKTAAEYRAMADECFKWAREARADEVRVSLLQLAQVWLDAATKLEGLSQTRATSAPDQPSKTARSGD